VHYVASKAGVIGLTRSMASDVGQYGITCNCISPGATITEIRRKTIDQKFIDTVLAKRHIKRMEVPEDLVGVAMFMASEASSFMTGQTIIIDGGMVFLP
jgi:3-oxoacyl-[acyl-carrier protein] reductase